MAGEACFKQIEKSFYIANEATAQVEPLAETNATLVES